MPHFARPLSAVLTALCMPALARPAPAQTDAAPPPHRLALLVGIGQYPGDTPLDLDGPPHDLALVAQLLRERFAFPPNAIVTLHDEAATHAGIVATFRRHLIDQARNGSEVVFWYCGHGSRIRDASGREADGCDNTLLAYDSRSTAPDGSYDVSDDELYSLLQELTAKTDRVVVVTDSCHSESVFRDGGEPAPAPGVRYATRGTAPLDLARVAPLWQGHPLLDDDAPARRAIDDRFVHVAACARWQLAAEQPFDGRMHGLLTWHLVRELERARPGDTWRHVVERVQLQVQQQRSVQTPTFDGNVDRAVFGGGFTAPPVGIPVRTADAAGTALTVEAGELQGLVVGSELRILPLSGDAALGRAKVTELSPDGLRSVAQWLDAAPAALQDQPLRALEVARPELAPRLLVSAPPGLIERLELGPWLRDVDATAADYVLAPADGGLGFSLRTVEGVPIWPLSNGAPRDVVATARSVIENAVRFRALAHLPLQPGTASLTVVFGEPSADDPQVRAFRGPRAMVVRDSPTGNQWHVELPATGEAATAQHLAALQITNTGKREVYVVVVSLEEAGCRRNAIWGYPGQEQSLLPPGETRSVPVALSHPSDWPLQRPMRDRYVVIATPQPVDVRRLTSWESGARRSGDEPLPWVLGGAFAPDRTRGRGVEAAERQWGVAWLDLHVR